MPGRARDPDHLAQRQSLGCVEHPLAAAAQAWPRLTGGSLVIVSP